MTSKDKRPPLIVLGIDAGDHRFIQEWADEGHLPAINSIMKGGFSGRTSGHQSSSQSTAAGYPYSAGFRGGSTVTTTSGSSSPEPTG